MEKSCTRKDLGVLVGSSFARSHSDSSGAHFPSELFSLLSVASKPSFLVRLNAVMQADLAWWHCLIHHWNGLSFFPSSQQPLHMYSDASGSFGCEAFCLEPSQWFQFQWPTSWLDFGTAAKELLLVVIAAVRCGNRWSGKHICFYSGNEAVVYAILKRYVNHSLLNPPLRCLFSMLLTLSSHIRLTQHHACCDFMQLQASLPRPLSFRWIALQFLPLFKSSSSQQFQIGD